MGVSLQEELLKKTQSEVDFMVVLIRHYVVSCMLMPLRQPHRPVKSHTPDPAALALLAPRLAPQERRRRASRQRRGYDRRHSRT